MLQGKMQYHQGHNRQVSALSATLLGAANYCVQPLPSQAAGDYGPSDVHFASASCLKRSIIPGMHACHCTSQPSLKPGSRHTEGRLSCRHRRGRRTARLLHRTGEGSGSQNQTNESSSEALVLFRDSAVASASAGLVTACARGCAQNKCRHPYESERSDHMLQEAARPHACCNTCMCVTNAQQPLMCIRSGARPQTAASV